jgi:hypothetical protein
VGAHTVVVIAGDGAEWIWKRASMFVRRCEILVLRMTARDLAIREGSSLRRGLRSTASCSVRMAGENEHQNYSVGGQIQKWLRTGLGR